MILLIASFVFVFSVLYHVNTKNHRLMRVSISRWVGGREIKSSNEKKKKKDEERKAFVKSSKTKLGNKNQQRN